MRWLFTIAALVVTTAAHATNPLVVFPERPERLRAVHYAKLDKKACLAELEARGIDAIPGPPVPTIDAPVRLPAKVLGMRYEFAHPTAHVEKKGPVLDCRLLLALGDLAIIAKDRGFVAIRYNSIHRGRWARSPGQRHAAGVAIDIVSLQKRDGSELVIKRDFHGHGIGSKTCGKDAPKPQEPEAKELRQLVCAVDRAKSFNLLLTPHYNRDHDNHFHFEVRRHIRWFLTQ
ncbi:MAG: extensin family protein [Myxococcales bacterium]|nr:extensin family protein [Myxococcales bacterium]MCB9576256.1 extensin family protein [Polyangiaceae bacterium]